MKLILLLFVCFVLAVKGSSLDTLIEDIDKKQQQPFNGTIWTVLVAGSNGWYNYRHQADICHAYQVLREHGIPDKNIIVMMYDDIAHNSENPKPGFIRNKPGGPNVYPGVPKDYTGEEVTPEKFLEVLGGSEKLAAQGKKVVKSGPNDHIFVYFSDHGAPGIIAFPSSELKATDMNSLLKKMHSQKKYNKMVLYIEACESGSMFQGLLPKNINIFATTAANSVESSYACYYDSEMQTYLGDVYSVMWLEDSDKSSFGGETLQKQFAKVKQETNTSHVQEFGDLKMGSLPLAEFQGSKNSNRSGNTWKREPITDAVPGPDVPLILAAKKAKKQSSSHLFRRYREEFETMAIAREYLNNSVSQIVKKIKPFVDVSFETLWVSKLPIKNHKCYYHLYDTFDTHCFDISTHPFGLRFLYVFVNFCNFVHNDWTNIASADKAMTRYCHQHIHGQQLRRIL